jgi:hypothetical protein
MEEAPDCIVCDKQLTFIPRMCCNGFDCGCMGQPIDPQVCSDECFAAAAYPEAK